MTAAQIKALFDAGFTPEQVDTFLQTEPAINATGTESPVQTTTTTTEPPVQTTATTTESPVQTNMTGTSADSMEQRLATIENGLTAIIKQMQADARRSSRQPEQEDYTLQNAIDDLAGVN